MELEDIDQKVLVFVVKRMWAQLQPQGVVHATCVNLGACNEPSTNVPNRTILVHSTRQCGPAHALAMLDRGAVQRPNGSRDSCSWDLATTTSTGESVNERKDVHAHSSLTAAHTSHIQQYAPNFKLVSLAPPLKLT